MAAITKGIVELGDEKYAKLSDSLSTAELSAVRDISHGDEGHPQQPRRNVDEAETAEEAEENRKIGQKRAAGRTRSAPNMVSDVARAKIAREFGISEKELMVHEYIQGINPKVWSKLGNKPTVDDLHLTYGIRMSLNGGKPQSSSPGGGANEVEPPRYYKLGKTMGLTDEELVNYDYIQSINPKVFDRSFGSRPAPSEITAPPRFRPRTVKDVLLKNVRKGIPNVLRRSADGQEDIKQDILSN
jgi:hypothetical protein